LLSQSTVKNDIGARFDGFVFSMKKVNYFFFGFIFAAMLFRSQAVFADQGLAGFSINPFIQNIDIQKDQTGVPFSVAVTNNTGSQVNLDVSVLDFGTLDESGGVAFLGSSDNAKYSLASWITLSANTLVLAPQQSQTLTGSIKNDDSLSPGGHYGAVMFKIQDDSNANADQNDHVAFNPSFASLLFVRKIGGETYGLHLDSEQVAKNLFSLPDSITLRFQNTGNVHVTPRGDVELSDPLGRLVAKSFINEQSGIILPETSRVFPEKFLSIAPAFLPGRYTLKTNYRYDGLDIFSDSSQTFLLVPPLFILAVVILLLVLVAMGYVLAKKKRKTNG